jgi:hypothetical protein
MRSSRFAALLPPMWVRWVLASAVAVALIVSLVIAVHRAGPDNSGSETEAGAEAEVNRVADIAIAEDEAPRSASLSSGAAPASALERAIARDVAKRIADERLTGPFEGVVCHGASKDTSGREPYNCTVHSANIAYPFVAIVDKRSRRLTWCKIDQPAKPGVGPEIPISASCLA